MGMGLGMGLSLSEGGSAITADPKAIWGANLFAYWLWSANTHGGSNLLTLSDLSSNGNNLAALGTPTYNASGGGNNSGFIYFATGTNMTATLGSTPSNPFTVWHVCRSLVSTASTQYLHDFGTNNHITFQQASGTSLQEYNGSLGATVASALNNDVLVESYFANDATSGIGLNGGSLTTATCGAAAVTSAFRLGNAGGGANPWLGNWYATVISLGTTTALQRAQMGAWKRTMVGGA